ncbi:MAG TPA: T9SS type A sorting domain-containing protein [Cytophagales bacterium]|nr:T9SS type A sorting domain-containing protein [Cytophagales bacterium]
MKKILLLKIFFSIFLFIFFNHISFAQNKIWANYTGNGLWSDFNNWIDSGGDIVGPPNSTTENAIFDGTSIDNCIIDVNPAGLGNFVINSGFPGEITKSIAGTLNVSGSFSIAGGTFSPGANQVNIEGVFTQTGGTFNATSPGSSVTNFRNNFTSSGGVFNHNNGTVRFSSRNLTIFNSPNFWDVEFSNAVGASTVLNFRIDNSITVNNLIINSGGGLNAANRPIYLNNGIITVSGNLSLTTLFGAAGSTSGGGTATIILNGSGGQIVTGRTTLGEMPLPNLEITSSTTRTIDFLDPSQKVTISGTLSITGAGSISINTGTIAVKGDVTLSNTGSGGGGTGTVLLNNTSAAQIVSGTSTFGNSALPNLAIDKGSASLTFGGTVSLTGSLNYVNSGIINMGSSSIAYSGGDGQVVLSPTGNFPPYYVLAITGTGTKTVSSTLTTCSNLYLGNSDLDVGDVSTNYLRITDNTQNSIIYGGTGKIIGNLERAVTTGVNYTYNVAVSGGSTQQFDINFTNTGSDNDYVSISFSDAPPGTNVEDSTEAGVTFNRMIEGGYWVINGSGSDNTNSVYDVVLHPVGFTSGTNEAYTVFKREGSGAWHASGTPVETPSTSITSVSRTGITGFSNIGVGGGDFTPTPVDLSHFNANLEKDHVLLDWATLSETKSSHFIIERSKTANEFKAIGRVESAGNSSERIEYAFEDEEALELFSTTLFYRLRQVDVDGQFKIYPMKAVDMSKIIDSKLNIYPNPAHADITVSSRFEKPLYLEVVNSNGKLIHTTSVKKGKTTLKKLSLQKGIYVFKFISGETVVNKRVAFE